MINFIGIEAQIVHVDRQITTQEKTGTNEADKMKNIYDLEGNNQEWTAQANLTSYRVYRGGFCSYASKGVFFPASNRRHDYSNSNYGYCASRHSLYVSL